DQILRVVIRISVLVGALAISGCATDGETSAGPESPESQQSSSPATHPYVAGLRVAAKAMPDPSGPIVITARQNAAMKVMGEAEAEARFQASLLPEDDTQGRLAVELAALEESQRIFDEIEALNQSGEPVLKGIADADDETLLLMGKEVCQAASSDGIDAVTQWAV